MIALSPKSAVMALNAGFRVDLSLLSPRQRETLVPVAYHGAVPVAAGDAAMPAKRRNAALRVVKVQLGTLAKGPVLNRAMARFGAANR